MERRKRDVSTRCFRGIDKDAFLTKVTKAYMAIVGDGRGGIFCEDSLAEPSHWQADALAGVRLESFDIVITNPPFGSKIKVTGKSKLAQYELSKKWKPPRIEGGDWVDTKKYCTDQSPQILFIERCI